MAVSTTLDQAEEIIHDQLLTEEKLLDEFENEEIPGHIREARMESLRQQTKELRIMQEKDHGKYSELTSEEKFFDLTTSVKKCVVHFYHPNFRRCAILDNHLEVLSKNHFEIKFAKISVDVAKFLVARLKIQVLPVLICFLDGIAVDRIIGFEELGNTDDFTTEVLEKRLVKAGMVRRNDEKQEETKSRSIFGRSRKNQDSDSNDDDD